MPELPEVETVRKGLHKLTKGFSISRIDVLKDRSIANIEGKNYFINNLKGATIGAWKRRGKYLLSSLKKHNNQESNGWLGVHLRMTGHFKIINEDKPICAHTRVRIWFQNGKELRFIDTRNFGQMWWVPPEKLPQEVITGLQKLGPEPFSKLFNDEYLLNALNGKTRSIKSALLDQSIVAGAGNIYADESLFDAGILPQRQCKKLNKGEIKKICNSLIKVLTISIGEGGTTFSDFRDLEGVNGNYGGKAWVYKRNKKSCRKCGQIILKEKIAGRGTHWCPSCQK